jgi:sulfite reductase (NADPH) hemoprotein beta-component
MTTRKLSRNETIKAESRRLRGNIASELDRPLTGAVPEDEAQLMKFHGIYLQDDRDERPGRGRRKLDKAYGFMARVRIPGGVLTPAQWLELDGTAGRHAGGTLRLTTRQTVQFHGILKGNLRHAIREIDAALLNTIAACGDVNRNVMCTPNPHLSALHAEIQAMAAAISDRLLPKTRAWHEIFLGEARVAGAGEEAEPIYGPTYLPRKFKIAVALPPDNDVDAYANDLAFVAIVEAGRIAGYTVLAGGGMGMTHGDAATFPRTADALGFCTPDQVLAVAEAVVIAQRDHGNRAERKNARLKYTIERLGLDAFRREVEARAGFTLAPARPFRFERTGDRVGWSEAADGMFHLTLPILAGRIADTAAQRLRSALAAVAAGGLAREFRITGNQNLILAGVAPEAREAVEALLGAHGVPLGASGLRRGAIACVALPTCGLALAEAERYVPELIGALEPELERLGIGAEEIALRVSGCPNGCARPFMAEIAAVGRGPGRYNLYLGGSGGGTRLNRLYRADLDHAGIVAALRPLLAGWAAGRAPGERFGDWVIRAGHIAEMVAGRDFQSAA